MEGELKALFLALAVAFALLVADRYFRISPFLERQGFAVQLQRCGVGMDACPHPLRCINGFCKSEDAPRLFDLNPLPVLP
jgi:hypothetical protein